VPSSQIEHQLSRTRRAFFLAFLIGVVGVGIELVFQERIAVLAWVAIAMVLGALAICFTCTAIGIVLAIRLFLSKAG
jgi:hypothetical protein